jgi:hypothetical protein
VARKDKATLSVTGTRDVRATFRAEQLRTTLVQAGLGRNPISPSLAGDVRFTTPRAIRAQYGKCPEPVPATVQAQLQGPPPPSPDFGSCMVLTETPLTTGAFPNGLDIDQLVGVGIELAGMSPNQAAAFHARFDWPAALSVSVPRFSRSYDTVNVAGVSAMLFNTASRRGPTYTLVWKRGSTVFALAGYGSSGDGVAAASSLR